MSVYAVAMVIRADDCGDADGRAGFAVRPSALPVLVWAGNDPSGGAGLAADTAALLSHGCHPCPVVTALTVQDSSGLTELNPVDAGLVERQARAVLVDLRVAAFKIGVIGSAENVRAIARVLDDYPHLPVVLDPVLRAGGDGADLASSGLLEELVALLLPRTTVITPNADEAALLVADGVDADAQAAGLMDSGCDYVLLTGGDQPGEQVVNHLYGPAAVHHRYQWPRLPGRYHGSGCTLAAALTGLLAYGEGVEAAAEAAQKYAWESLRHAYTHGRGQSFPQRLYWAVGGR